MEQAPLSYLEKIYLVPKTINREKYFTLFSTYERALAYCQFYNVKIEKIIPMPIDTYSVNIKSQQLVPNEAFIF